MKWPWSKKDEPETEPDTEGEGTLTAEVTPDESGEVLNKPLGFAHVKHGNKHEPTKHKAFPNKMNRNKRMP